MSGEREGVWLISSMGVWIFSGTTQSLTISHEQNSEFEEYRQVVCPLLHIMQATLQQNT